MADKREVIAGLFRGGILAGAWVRLAAWRKHGTGRRIELVVDDGGFSLRLLEGDRTIYEGSSDTFEGVTHLAVTALGKAV